MNSKQQEEYHKSSLIIKLLKDLLVDQLSVPQMNKENIQKFIDYLIIKDHARLDKENTVLGKILCMVFETFLDHKFNFIGIPEEQIVEPVLTYTERKALKEYLDSSIEKYYKPLVDYYEQYEEETGHHGNAKEQVRAEIIETEKEIQVQTQKLIDLKKQKLELMQQIVEIRVGPDQRDTVERYYQAANSNQLMAE